MDVVDETEALQRFFEGKNSWLFYTHAYDLHMEVGNIHEIVYASG